jgi:hypothetical protein
MQHKMFETLDSYYSRQPGYTCDIPAHHALRSSPPGLHQPVPWAEACAPSTAPAHGHSRRGKHKQAAYWHLVPHVAAMVLSSAPCTECQMCEAAGPAPPTMCLQSKCSWEVGLQCEMVYVQCSNLPNVTVVLLRFLLVAEVVGLATLFTKHRPSQVGGQQQKAWPCCGSHLCVVLLGQRPQCPKAGHGLTMSSKYSCIVMQVAYLFPVRSDHSRYGIALLPNARFTPWLEGGSMQWRTWRHSGLVINLSVLCFMRHFVR